MARPLPLMTLTLPRARYRPFFTTFTRGEFIASA